MPSFAEITKNRFDVPSEANPLAGSPVSSASLVANRVKRPPASFALASETNPIDELADIETIMQTRYGPYVVAHGRPVCKCGCDWTEDSGTSAKVQSVCVMCRTEIFLNTKNNFEK